MDEVFRWLGGVNAIEYQKNLGIYINDLKEMRPGQRQMVVNRLMPRNIQEDLAYVKILLTFKENDKLLKVLYSTNWILTKVIIKNTAFLHYIASNNDLFLKEVCQKVSYNCRVGILRNLAKILVQGQDAFYHKIFEMFGKQEANLILTTCSKKMIIQMHEKFTDREMIRLYKRFGYKILNWYYELSNDNKPGNAIINFLVKENDGTALVALMKYNIKLGKKGMILVLNTNKAEIINNPRKYQRWKSLIYRYLKEDEWITYFKNLFPISELDFSNSDDIYNNLLLLPEDERFEALSTGYHELYKDEIEIQVGAKILMAIPIEYRLEFIVRNDSKFGDSAVVTSTTLCNINAQKNVHYRISMYKTAVLNCKINNDKAALLVVLNHISTKGYNYSFPIRETVLLALKEHFKLLQLSKKHWDCVKILINGFKENNETFFDRVYFTEVDLIKSVKAGEEDFTLLNKYLMEGGCFRLWSLDKICPKMQRKIAMMMGQLITKDYTNQPKLVVDFLSFLEDYNRKRRKTRISYYAYGTCLEVLLEKFGHQGNFYYASIVESVLCYKAENSEEQKLQKMLWRHYLMMCNPESYSQKVIINILIQRPEIIIENADRIKKNIFTEYKFFFQCAKMHYTSVYKYFDHICLKCYKKNFRIEVEKYLDDINENDTNIVNLFFKRLYFYSLTTTPIPYFDLAMPYLNSDFSKDVPAVTNNLLRKIPLEDMRTDIVPIYYSTILTDLPTTRRTIEFNKNCDYKQRIKTAINCFTRDPSEEYMQMLLRIIKPESHSQVLKILHRFHKIPKDRILDYAEFIWSNKKTMTMNVAWYLTIPMLLKLKHSMIHNLFIKLLELEPSERTVQFICGYLKRDHNFTFFFHTMQSTTWNTAECTRFMLLMCQEILKYKDSQNIGVFTFMFLQKIELQTLPEKMVYQYRVLIELVQSYVLHAFDEFIKEKQRILFDIFNRINRQECFGFEAINYLSKYIETFLTILPAKSIAIRVSLANLLVENEQSLSANYLAICILPLNINKLGFASDVKTITQKLLKQKDQKMRMLVKKYINSCDHN